MEPTQPSSILPDVPDTSGLASAHATPVKKNRCRKKGGGKSAELSNPDSLRAAREAQADNDNPLEDRHQNGSSSIDTTHIQDANLRHASQPVEPTADSCVYTVQAVHGILTAAAMHGEYHQVSAMKSKYRSRKLRVDQNIQIAAEDASFFHQWNTQRETTAQRQCEQEWILNYSKLHAETHPNMPLEKFATLAAVSAVLHTKNQSVPTTSLSVSSELLQFDSGPHPNADQPASSQDNRPSTNVAGQTISEGRDKKVKTHDVPVITVVYAGQPSFVQAVIQLLAGPLQALLGTDRYKTFLQRPARFSPLDPDFAHVDVPQLVNLPAHISSLLQGRPSQVDMSWLANLQHSTPVAHFARQLVRALEESLRSHPMEPKDAMDFDNDFREAGLSSRYQDSPVERLFTSLLACSITCCGGRTTVRYTGDLFYFDRQGEVKPPTQSTCRTCSRQPPYSYVLGQAPAFVLVGVVTRLATFTQPPQFDFQSIDGFEYVPPNITYRCCGYIIQEQDQSFTTLLLSRDEWRRYGSDNTPSVVQNINAVRKTPTPLSSMLIPYSFPSHT
jgi:hypothetical protein